MKLILHQCSSTLKSVKFIKMNGRNSSCACTGILCVHKNLVQAQESCACTRFLWMHKILLHASGGSKTIIISMCLFLFPRNVYTNHAFYQRNDGWPSPSTAHAHKKCSGDRKNGNRDRSGKWVLVCTGYRNIMGAPQAFAIWGNRQPLTGGICSRSLGE